MGDWIRRRSQRGNLLAMAMAFMFVLVTIVIAMHTTQARAVRSVTQAEAELQFRQSSEFAVADLLLGATAAPGSLRVSTDHELVGELEMPALYAKKLWSGLPNWNPEKDQEFAPGHRTYKLFPKTSDEALKVFAGKFLWMVAHDSGGYAVYAPNGRIELEQAMGWANPNFVDERPVATAYSGVPLLLASKLGIDVQKMPYGNAYSMEGPIELGRDKKDLAVPFQGALPLRPYETELKKSLNAARASLESAAQAGGDKTNDISGGVLAGVGGVLKMLITGDATQLNVSLEQAMGFPFPMIPGFSITVPGTFYELWFHVPFAPDIDLGNDAAEDGDGGAGQKNGQEVAALDGEIKALQAAIADLNTKIAAESDQSEKNKLIEQRDEKKDELKDKEDELKDLQEEIEEASKEATEKIEDEAAAGPGDPPETRNDDKDIPKTGQKGWNYSKLLGNMLSLLWNAITGDLEELATSVAPPVRLVHFGDKDNVPDFRFDDGFFAKATWTVPRGRSFKYTGKMEIEGDLWLQKGSVMQVTGDLVMSNPDGSSANPLKPCGKLVMEEGSTLIVGGNLTCAGDPRFGSLWVCSPPTHLAPITTAIFVQGTATIPYGSFSATNLEDVARAIGGLDAVGDAFEVLFTDIAPNLAKIVGPFHERAPYFASYATTFQLTMVPTPVGQIPVPTPIPIPKKNMLIPLFRALTLVYTGTLNISLGENLYTHADWWGFGQGVVPAMVKLNPLGPLKSNFNLKLDIKLDIDWNQYITKLTETVLKGAAEFAIREVGKKLVSQVMAAIAPAGGSIISMLLDETFDAVAGKENAFGDFREEVLKAALGPIERELKRIKDDIEDEITKGLKEAYLREVGGALLYAGTISVGDPSDPPLLMAGMLVAENNINVDTDSFVGSLTSFNGNISAGSVYFTPVFTRASLYKPKATATNAIARVVQVEYGNHFDSTEAVDVGTGVWQVSTEGWSR